MVNNLLLKEDCSKIDYNTLKYLLKMGLKVKEHIQKSSSVKKCKGCSSLMIAKYLDNIYCDTCEKKYNSIVNKILNC